MLLLLGKFTRRLADFFNDREYYRQLFVYAAPIALQNLVTSGLNMVGVILVGQLGDTAVAAVGLAGQLFFLLNLVLFGISSGAAIFTAQLWGRRDIANVRRVLGLGLILSLACALVFLALAQVIPQAVLGVYTRDPVVIDLGSRYLRVFSPSYLFFAVTISVALILRSIGDVRTPLLVSASALTLNTILSYVLIFGKLGFPTLGVQGVALAGLLARLIECVALVWMVYRLRSPIAGRLGEIFSIDWLFALRVLKPVIPVVMNETFWSLGITAYYVVYARISTESIAAMNIVAAIDNLAIVVFLGIGHACAVLVGNRIGAGREDEAHTYAGRSLVLGMLGGLAVGGLILASSNLLLDLYRVSPQVIAYTSRVLNIIASLLWLRACNIILFIGVFRSGGDTRFAFLLDAVIIWVVGVPLAFLGAFVLNLPVYSVYFLTQSEEVLKWSIGLARYYSRKWIHNLAKTV